MKAKIIAVMNQKGGCGKTTLSVHLGAGFARLDKKVAILDADRQESAFRWGQRAAIHKRRAPPVHQVRSETTAAVLMSLRDGRGLVGGGDRTSDPELVVIDTAGEFREGAQRLALDLLGHVDLVIVPVLPTPFDLDGAHELLVALQTYRATHPEPQVVVMLNKAKRNRMTTNARSALTRYGFPVLETAFFERNAYAAEVGFGGTALDRRPSDKARQEVNALLDELCTYVEVS